MEKYTGWSRKDLGLSAVATILLFVVCQPSWAQESASMGGDTLSIQEVVIFDGSTEGDSTWEFDLPTGTLIRGEVFVPPALNPGLVKILGPAEVPPIPNLVDDCDALANSEQVHAYLDAVCGNASFFAQLMEGLNSQILNLGEVILDLIDATGAAGCLDLTDPVSESLTADGDPIFLGCVECIEALQRIELRRKSLIEMASQCSVILGDLQDLAALVLMLAVDPDQTDLEILCSLRQDVELLMSECQKLDVQKQAALDSIDSNKTHCTLDTLAASCVSCSGGFQSTRVVQFLGHVPAGQVNQGDGQPFLRQLIALLENEARDAHAPDDADSLLNLVDRLSAIPRERIRHLIIRNVALDREERPPLDRHLLRGVGFVAVQHEDATDDGCAPQLIILTPIEARGPIRRPTLVDERNLFNAFELFRRTLSREPRPTPTLPPDGDTSG